MTTTITGTEMTSTRTRHTARKTEGGWIVSWLPGRYLSQPQAVTAMAIAEAIGIRGELPSEADPLRLHVDAWAAELGLDEPVAHMLEAIDW